MPEYGLTTRAIHAGQAPDRAAGLVHLSIGVEDGADLPEDLEQTLDRP